MVLDLDIYHPPYFWDISTPAGPKTRVCMPLILTEDEIERRGAILSINLMSGQWIRL